jgi:hypothetical protein
MYSLEESDPDKETATRIRIEAGKLVGIALIARPIEMPEVLSHEGWDEQKYLNSRLLGINKLSEYLIMSALRSSKAALLEHLAGTTAALTSVAISEHAKKQRTGNQMDNLRRRAGRAPGSHLSIGVPSWVTDDEAHREMAALELETYERILRLAHSLSTDREGIKARMLLSLLGNHEQVLAFDSRPITLAYMAHILEGKIGRDQIILATGESPAGKKRAVAAMAPGSQKIRNRCPMLRRHGGGCQPAASVCSGPSRHAKRCPCRGTAGWQGGSNG